MRVEKAKINFLGMSGKVEIIEGHRKLFSVRLISIFSPNKISMSVKIFNFKFNNLRFSRDFLVQCMVIS